MCTYKFNEPCATVNDNSWFWPLCKAACSTLVFSDNLFLKLNESVTTTRSDDDDVDVTSSQNFPFASSKIQKPLLPSMLYYPIIHSSSSGTLSRCRNFHSLRHDGKDVRCAKTDLQLRVPYYKGCDLQYMSPKSN